MKTIGTLGLVVFLGVLYGILYSLPTMLLWNWLMPEIFGLKQIGFWQSLGITLLSGILFKSNNSSKD